MHKTTHMHEEIIQMGDYLAKIQHAPLANDL